MLIQSGKDQSNGILITHIHVSTFDGIFFSVTHWHNYQLQETMRNVSKIKLSLQLCTFAANWHSGHQFPLGRNTQLISSYDSD